MYSEIRIEGLETLDYLDNLSNIRSTDQGNALTFESEVIYLFMITTFTYIFDAKLIDTFFFRAGGSFLSKCSRHDFSYRS
jgi:glucose-6-phosphate 1-epimerase